MPEKYQQTGKLKSGSVKKTSARTNFWLSLSLILLAVSLLVYFGFWGYKNSLNQEKNDLKNQLADLTAQRDLKTETELVALKENIDNLKGFLDERIYASKIFGALEELILPQVQCSDLNTDLSEGEISLTVQANDYKTLAEQVVVFQEDERFNEVDFSGVDLGESGRVSSLLKIIVDLNYLSNYE